MKEKRYSYDFVTSIVLILLSIYIIFSSIGIYEDAGEKLYKSPGLMPLFLGVVLLIFALILFGQCIKNGEHNLKVIVSKIVKNVQSDDFINILVGIFIMGVYTFVLIKALPFWLSSLLLLIILMLFLNAAKLWKISLISISTVSIIYFVFKILFKVPLP